MIKKSAYIHLSDIRNFTKNTGIQRTIRQLSKKMMENGIDLIPIKESEDSRMIQICSKEDLSVLADFDGPKEDLWNIYRLNGNLPEHDIKTFIMADISWSNSEKILNFCKNNDIDMYSIFYDGIPITLSHIYGNDLKNRHQKYINDISLGKGVFTISESAKREFLQYMPENGTNNIEVIMLPNELAKNRPPKKQNNTKDIKMLYVSALNERKNHLRLLDAFNAARNLLESEGYTLSLAFVGPSFGHPLIDEIKRSAENKGVKIFSDIPYDELRKMYLDADFTIYPSEYEGYGLPIIESLSMNTPVICSNNSSMPEIASQGGCLMFDPYSVSQMSKMIYRMAKSSKLRDKLISEIDNIPHRSWDDYAKDVIKFIYGENNG